MIYVTAIGSNKVRRKFAEAITWWFINKQLPRYRNLTIHLDLFSVTDVQGSCVNHGDNEFVIEVDTKLLGGDFIECLIHELIHVEQHLKNLYEINEKHDHIPYFERLFEQDAYARSEILCKEYINREWTDYARKSKKIRDLVA
tara:strand:+ start:2467 stop:2895 length:429 start_codon:yes stop_codon:yes gene_type:complete